jgi:hypothetical protein
VKRYKRAEGSGSARLWPAKRLPWEKGLSKELCAMLRAGTDLQIDTSRTVEQLAADVALLKWEASRWLDALIKAPVRKKRSKRRKPPAGAAN